MDAKRRRRNAGSSSNGKKKRVAEEVEAVPAKVESNKTQKLVSEWLWTSKPYTGKQLPNDVLIIVFGYLAPRELAVASCVNSQWKGLIFSAQYDAAIWKYACLKAWQLKEGEVILACTSWLRACRTTPPSHMMEAVKITNQVLEGNSTQLFLVHLKLTALPTLLFTLNKLERLSLFGNCITHLPNEIGGLVNLQNLCLYYNRLATLPPEICALTKLVCLGLSHNRLTSIPREICSLSSLKRLELDNNRLEHLPREMVGMHSLGTLYLSHNRLDSGSPDLDHIKTSLNQITDCDY